MTTPASAAPSDSLGDGYWRLNQRDTARQVWREGLAAFPDADCVRVRLNAGDEAMPDIIERALDAGVRVDTTLVELFPDITRLVAGKSSR